MTDSTGFADDDVSPLHMFIAQLDHARQNGIPDDWVVASFLLMFSVESIAEREEELQILAQRDEDWRNDQKHFKLFEELWGRDAKDPFENEDGEPHVLTETVKDGDVTWSMEDIKKTGKFPENP